MRKTAEDDEAMHTPPMRTMMMALMQCADACGRFSQPKARAATR